MVCERMVICMVKALISVICGILFVLLLLLPLFYSMPVSAASSSWIVDISACSDNSYALMSDGTVWAWGFNNDGQLGDGTNESRSLPVQVPISGVKSIYATSFSCFALKDDGTVWAWGYNGYGNLW